MSGTEIPERLGRSVIRFYERLSGWEEEVAAQVGLTPRQCHVVQELGEVGLIRMKPLSERLGITTGTLTIMADRLQNLGLICRVEDSTDKRAWNIELTEGGKRVYEEHIRHHAALSRELLSSISETEAEAFIATIEKALCAF